MKTFFTVEEYVELVKAHLTTTLTRDFGAEGGHIVDLLSNTTTQLDSIYYWMAEYPREIK